MDGSESKICRVFYQDSTISYYECPRPGDSADHLFCCDNACCNKLEDEQQLQFYATQDDESLLILPLFIILIIVAILLTIAIIMVICSKYRRCPLYGKIPKKEKTANVVNNNLVTYSPANVTDDEEDKLANNRCVDDKNQICCYVGEKDTNGKVAHL